MWHKSINHHFTPFDETNRIKSTTIQPGTYFVNEIIEKIKNELNEDVVVNENGELRITNVCKTIDDKPYSSKVAFIKISHLEETDVHKHETEHEYSYPSKLETNRPDLMLTGVQLFADVSNSYQESQYKYGYDKLLNEAGWGSQAGNKAG